jgi:hypothetical protein
LRVTHAKRLQQLAHVATADITNDLAEFHLAPPI